MAEKKHCYSNGEVTIVWKPHVCTYAEHCWKGLPAVFKPGERPWIDPKAATTEEIIAQVKQCPSGALSFVMSGDGPASPEKY